MKMQKNNRRKVIANVIRSMQALINIADCFDIDSMVDEAEGVKNIDDMLDNMSEDDLYDSFGIVWKEDK